MVKKQQQFFWGGLETSHWFKLKLMYFWNETIVQASDVKSFSLILTFQVVKLLLPKKKKKGKMLVVVLVFLFDFCRIIQIGDKL